MNAINILNRIGFLFDDEEDIRICTLERALETFNLYEEFCIGFFKTEFILRRKAIENAIDFMEIEEIDGFWLVHIDNSNSVLVSNAYKKRVYQVGNQYFSLSSYYDDDLKTFDFWRVDKEVFIAEKVIITYE